MKKTEYIFKTTLLSIFIFTILLVISCTGGPEVKPDSISVDDSNENALDAYLSGVFVINEGNFGSDDGSISFIDPNGIVRNNIFSENNALRRLGDVVQSMYANGTSAFILVNNSNKIEVVDINQMTLLHTISEVSLPRYMISDGKYGYISEWVSFSDPGRISILNLDTYEIIDTINVGFGAEALTIRDSKLYVSNNFENNLSMIDLRTHQIVKTISVGPSPAAMVIDKNGDLWVVCSGDYNANNGSLVRLDSNDDVIQEISLGMNVSGKLVTENDSSILYFYSGTKVYSYALGDEIYNTFIENTSATSFYGIGMSPDGDMYIADSKGFQSRGSVYVYDNAGQMIEEFEVGRGPNGFVFKSE